MIAQLLRKIVPEYWRPIGHLVHMTRERTGQRVASGPFVGLRYSDDSVGSAYIPKLLGIYEREIAECIEDACAAQPDVIIDIGAAEGYYVCGMARRLANSHVIAFEIEERGQAALAKMAALNGLEARVDVRGKCEPEDLATVLAEADRPLVICDAEGDEAVLLGPPRVPSLRKA